MNPLPYSFVIRTSTWSRWTKINVSGGLLLFWGIQESIQFFASSISRAPPFFVTPSLHFQSTQQCISLAMYPYLCPTLTTAGKHCPRARTHVIKLSPPAQSWMVVNKITYPSVLSIRTETCLRDYFSAYRHRG